MKHTATCPACHQETHMIHVFMALTPFSFKCGHCRARVHIRGMLWWVLGLYVLMGVPAIMLAQYIVREDKFVHNLYFLVPATIILVMEVIRVLLVCNRAKLLLKTKK